MAKDLKDEIRKQILSSGFPLEINSANLLFRRGWNVETNTQYFNDEIQKLGENDIRAARLNKKGRTILVIECKKSSSIPWVLFHSDEKIKEATAIPLAGRGSYEPFESILSKHWYLETDICTYYLTGLGNSTWEADETVRNQKEDIKEGQLREAVVQVMSSLKYYLTARTAFINALQAPCIEALYPVIVFDGNLFAAKIKEGDVQIEESKHLLLKVNIGLKEVKKIPVKQGTTRLTTTRTYFIDVVKKEEFENYLKKVETFNGLIG